jgi:hypothetical protein
MATLIIFFLCYNYVTDDYEDEFDLEEREELLSSFHTYLVTAPTTSDYQLSNMNTNTTGDDLHSTAFTNGFVSDTQLRARFTDKRGRTQSVYLNC